MFHVSLILESLRAHPRLMFWVAALAQAALWTLLPSLFYAAPPGDLPLVLAVGHEWQLGSLYGPPLAFWLAESLTVSAAACAGVYLLSQLCVVATLMGGFALGRSMVGTAHAAMAILLMAGISVFGADAGIRSGRPRHADLDHGAPAFLARGGRGPERILDPARRQHGAAPAHRPAGMDLFRPARGVCVATVQGRAAFRSVDPWLCVFVAVLVAAPYLAWLVHADDVWKPALTRLQAIDLRAAAADGLLILWYLSVAHVGVVLFAVLASPWRLPRGTRAADGRSPRRCGRWPNP